MVLLKIIFQYFVRSISICMLFVFIVLSGWVLDLLFGFYDSNVTLDNVVTTALIFGIPVVFLCVLPVDFIAYRRDKKICESEGIAYKDFIEKDVSFKKEIYDKYSDTYKNDT